MKLIPLQSIRWMHSYTLEITKLVGPSSDCLCSFWFISSIDRCWSVQQNEDNFDNFDNKIAIRSEQLNVLPRTSFTDKFIISSANRKRHSKKLT